MAAKPSIDAAASPPAEESKENTSAMPSFASPQRALTWPTPTAVGGRWLPGGGELRCTALRRQERGWRVFQGGSLHHQHSNCAFPTRGERLRPVREKGLGAPLNAGIPQDGCELMEKCVPARGACSQRWLTDRKTPQCCRQGEADKNSGQRGAARHARCVPGAGAHENALRIALSQGDLVSPKIGPGTPCVWRGHAAGHDAEKILL